jgi:sugar lactone lactonase YvrE
MSRILIVLLLALPCTALPAESKTDSAGQENVLVSGGHFLGINGLMFGPDGLLYLASAASPAIAAVDPQTGSVVREFRGTEGVFNPDDLAFGPDGSVYWTNILAGSVFRQTPDGTVSVISEAGPGVNPITFSDDGRLFVSKCFLGSDLFELDPQGEAPDRVITDQLGPGCGLNGMDWGPDGLLYGPRWFHGEVVRVDVGTGAFETVAAGFGVPAAVKFDSGGNLYVLDSLRGEIVKVNPENGDRSVTGRVEPSTADNLAVSPQDRVFVSSFGDGWIKEILDDGTTRTVVPGGRVNMPGGLAWLDGPGGQRLYVADFFALRTVDPESGEVNTIARDIAGFSEMGTAFTVSAHGSNLVLSDWFGQAVRIWDPSAGELVAKFDGFDQPVDAVSFAGRILVSNAGNGAVVLVDPDGAPERSVVVDGLKRAAGLAAAGGDAFVCDYAAGTILQIIEDGATLPDPRVVADALDGPEGLAATGEALFVVETGAGRLTRIGRASGERSVLMGNLHTSDLLFDAVALGGDSRVYVTAGGTVYVLEAAESP